MAVTLTAAAVLVLALLIPPTLDLTPVQTDDRGHVTFTSDPFIIVASVAKQLSTQMATKAGVDVTATCDAAGRTVIVGGAATTFPCTVTNVANPTDSVGCAATIADDKGTVSFAVAG